MGLLANTRSHPLECKLTTRNTVWKLPLYRILQRNYFYGELYHCKMYGKVPTQDGADGFAMPASERQWSSVRGNVNKRWESTSSYDPCPEEEDDSAIIGCCRDSRGCCQNSEWHSRVHPLRLRTRLKRMLSRCEKTSLTHEMKTWSRIRSQLRRSRWMKIFMWAGSFHSVRSCWRIQGSQGFTWL